MTVTVCQRIPPAGKRTDRQPTESIRGRGRQWRLLFLHRTFQWKKGVGLPACCLNLRQTSSSCLGHGTSQSHCHFVPQCCNVTMMDFSSVSVYFLYIFPSINTTRPNFLSITSSLLIAKSSMSLAECKMLGIGYWQNTCDINF